MRKACALASAAATDGLGVATALKKAASLRGAILATVAAGDRRISSTIGSVAGCISNPWAKAMPEHDGRNMATARGGKKPCAPAVAHRVATLLLLAAHGHILRCGEGERKPCESKAKIQAISGAK